MKIKYQEWKCIACGVISRFTGRGPFSKMPHWFTISVDPYVSSNGHPAFDTTACSTTCLGRATDIISVSLMNRNQSAIPNKKDIRATICDQCGKVAKIDKLNIMFGPGPQDGWTWEENPEGRKDFCSEECRRNHSTNPEESVFVNFMCGGLWGIDHLLEIIDSPDFVVKLKALRPPELITKIFEPK